MNTATVLLGLLVAVGIVLLLVASTRWNLSLQKHRWDLQALAKATCPLCNTKIGDAEAQHSNDRSDELIRRNMTALATVGQESHWPVRCPGCSQRLVYWLATRKLHTAEQLLREGWIRDHDL